MEYVIYCDESSDKWPKYCDFFGGCMVARRDLDDIARALESKKAELNLFGEVKWSKVTEAYLHKYEELIHLFFDFVRAGKLHVRIMFRCSDDRMERAEDLNKYKYFNDEICTIHSNFNIGVSTGKRGFENPHWESPYEHWCFKPKEIK